MNENYFYQKHLISKVGGHENWSWDFVDAKWMSSAGDKKSYDIHDIRIWAKESDLPFDPAEWEEEHITLFKLTFG